MIEYYKKRAQEYEEIYAKPERQKSIEECKLYLRNIFKGRSLLEIACGTGFWTVEIAKTAKSIHATDINQEVIEIAKTKEFSNNKPTFDIQDFYLFPENIQYNGVFLGFFYSHIAKTDLPFLIKKLIKVSEADTVICFLDNLYVEGKSTKISRIDANQNTYQIRKLKDGTEYEILKNFPSKKELKELVAGVSRITEYKTNDFFWSFMFTL